MSDNDDEVLQKMKKEAKKNKEISDWFNAKWYRRLYRDAFLLEIDLREFPKLNLANYLNSHDLKNIKPKGFLGNLKRFTAGVGGFIAGTIMSPLIAVSTPILALAISTYGMAKRNFYQIYKNLNGDSLHGLKKGLAGLAAGSTGVILSALAAPFVLAVGIFKGIKNAIVTPFLTAAMAYQGNSIINTLVKPWRRASAEVFVPVSNIFGSQSFIAKKLNPIKEFIFGKDKIDIDEHPELEIERDSVDLSEEVKKQEEVDAGFELQEDNDDYGTRKPPIIYSDRTIKPGEKDNTSDAPNRDNFKPR